MYVGREGIRHYQAIDHIGSRHRQAIISDLTLKPQKATPLLERVKLQYRSKG
jgi:hypothetical protein